MLTEEQAVRRSRSFKVTTAHRAWCLCGINVWHVEISVFCAFRSLKGTAVLYSWGYWVGAYAEIKANATISDLNVTRQDKPGRRPVEAGQSWETWFKFLCENNSQQHVDSEWFERDFGIALSCTQTTRAVTLTRCSFSCESGTRV